MTFKAYLSEIQKPKQQIYAGIGIPACYAWYSILNKASWMLDYNYGGFKYVFPRFSLIMLVVSIVWAALGLCYLFLLMSWHLIKKDIKNSAFTSSVLISAWAFSFVLVQILQLIDYQS